MEKTTEDTITVKKSTFKILTYIVVILLIGIAFTGGYLIGQTTTGNVVAQQQDTGDKGTDTNNKPVQVSDGGNAILGNENAPVTIIEFSDFQCPYCERFVTQTMPQIKSEYIDTGKVKLFFRDFPLSFHPNAKPAAIASECANEQGKFWEMHDKLFANQDSLSTENYKAWAKELGLNENQFNTCIDSQKYASQVQKDFDDGVAAGVSGTPTFFVNGQKLVGAQPFSVFKQVIDAELAK
jgi:protein-disulfide isomerase